MISQNKTKNKNENYRTKNGNLKKISWGKIKFPRKKNIPKEKMNDNQIHIQ